MHGPRPGLVKVRRARGAANRAHRATLRPPTPRAPAQWWKKFVFTQHKVSRHLSPFEQKALTPMFKNWQGKVQQKVGDNVVDAGLPLAFGAGLIWWADKAYEEELRHHRS